MNNQEGLEIVGSLEQPEANTTIYITDNFTVYGYRKKPFTWLQIKMIKFLLGWRVGKNAQ